VTFTERHPDIVDHRPALEELKAQRQREREQKQRDARARKPIASQQEPGPRDQQLTISMAEYDANIAGLKERVREYERRLSELSAAANAIPQVEAQYTQLTRDYEVHQEELRPARRQARIGAAHRRRAIECSTMEFRVIDPPLVSAQPDWPNRPLLRSLVLLAAIGMGIAFAFLMSRLRPTVDSERMLREMSGLEVFGTVSLAWTNEQKRRQKSGLVALAFARWALRSVCRIDGGAADPAHRSGGDALHPVRIGNMAAGGRSWKYHAAMNVRQLSGGECEHR
jgi:hypothetical protein